MSGVGHCGVCEHVLMSVVAWLNVSMVAWGVNNGEVEVGVEWLEGEGRGGR